MEGWMLHPALSITSTLFSQNLAWQRVCVCVCVCEVCVCVPSPAGRAYIFADFFCLCHHPSASPPISGPSHHFDLRKGPPENKARLLLLQRAANQADKALA